MLETGRLRARTVAHGIMQRGIEIPERLDAQLRVGQDARRAAHLLDRALRAPGRDRIGIVADDRRGIDDVEHAGSRASRSVFSRGSTSATVTLPAMSLSPNRPFKPREAIFVARLGQMPRSADKPASPAPRSPMNANRSAMFAPTRRDAAGRRPRVSVGPRKVPDTSIAVRAALAWSSSWLRPPPTVALGVSSAARHREGVPAGVALAGEADRAGESGVGRLDRLEIEIDRQLQSRIDIAHASCRRRSPRGSSATRTVSPFPLAEGPGVALAGLVPFEVDRPVEHVQPLHPPRAEDQREGGDARIDLLRFEQVRLRSPSPGWRSSSPRRGT